MSSQSKKFKAERGYKTYSEPVKELLDPILLRDGVYTGRVIFTSEEFSSLCPLTDQPDWATLEIRAKLYTHTLESKSLKLYLHAFRNYKGFAEDINIKILNDIYETIKPRWLLVTMNWRARGGITIQTSFVKGKEADEQSLFGII